MGTAGYTSPEQVRGLEADHLNDIFSFGITLADGTKSRERLLRVAASPAASARGNGWCQIRRTGTWIVGCNESSPSARRSAKAAGVTG